MKLQTKLMLGFSLILVMTLSLGGASYYLTGTMNRLSTEAAYIESSKTARPSRLLRSWPRPRGSLNCAFPW